MSVQYDDITSWRVRACWRSNKVKIPKSSFWGLQWGLHLRIGIGHTWLIGCIRIQCCSSALCRCMPFHASSCAPEQLILINLRQFCGFLPASLFGCVAGTKAEGKRGELIPKQNSILILRNWFGFSPNDKAQTTVICKVCRGAVCQLDGTNYYEIIVNKLLPLLSHIFVLLFQQTKRHFRISHIIYFIIFYIWQWFGYTI